MTTTADELGIEAVTRIIVSVHVSPYRGARKGGGHESEGHERIPISRPRLRFLEKRSDEQSVR